MRRTRLLKLEESNNYKIIYSGVGRSRTNGRISLILLVGAGRFERPTPCAQGSFRPFFETACFLMLTFQADVASLLRLVEWFGIWRLWAATFSSTLKFRIE